MTHYFRGKHKRKVSKEQKLFLALCFMVGGVSWLLLALLRADLQITILGAIIFGIGYLEWSRLT